MNTGKKIGLIGTLASTIIGAGVFSLPYIFKNMGVKNGLFLLFFFLLIYIFVHLMYAKLIERNSGAEFGSLAKKYFGKYGGIATWMIVLELIFVSVVYIILASEFLSVLWGGEHLFGFTLIFWLFGILGMFFSMRVVEIFETAGLFGMCLLIGIVGVVGFFFQKGIVGNNFEMSFQSLVLIGPLLFAFSGRPIIARITRTLKNNEKKHIYSIIAWGTGIPAIVYTIYTLGVLSMNVKISENVIETIVGFPSFIPIVLSVLGIIALWTSYFVIGINIRDILSFDVNINKKTALFVSAVFPIVLYMLGAKNFIQAISFVGGLFLGLEGLLIVRMWQKEYKKKNIFFFTSFCFLIVFLIVIIQEVKSFIW